MKILLTLLSGIIAFSASSQSVTAGFSSPVTSGCVPFTAQFTNTSINATAWFWDFGNGNTSQVQHPSNVYIQPGSYTVKLIAFNGSLSDTLILNNFISASPAPSADFSALQTSACPGTAISFTNLSQYGQTYLWDFGDGSVSSQPNPVHTYTSSGTYTVKLIATSGTCSTLKTINQFIHVFPKPTAALSSSDQFLCGPGNNIQFFATSSANITSWKWKFGDGDTSTQQNPFHIYSTSGNFQPSLKMISSNGCADSILHPGTIMVNTAPQVTVSRQIQAGCIPVNVQFSNNYSGTGSVLWDFGDGTYSSQPNTSHPYQGAGSFSPVMTINEGGCTYQYSFNQPLQILPDPVPSFTAQNTTGCPPLAVGFNNTTQNSVACQWTFGDGTNSSVQNPNHNYTTGGSYNVTLSALNANGCQKQFTSPGLVNIVKPQAAFTVSSAAGCSPVTATFNNTSVNAVQHLWNFGDGTTSTLASPSHTYSVPGNYSVRLKVWNSAGCTDTVIKTNIINVVNPLASYITPSTDTVCAPYTTSLSGVFTGADSLLWNFGDGTTSNLLSPTHTYTQPGTYTVSLLVNFQGGCSGYIPVFAKYVVSDINAGFVIQTGCDSSRLVDTTNSSIAWEWSVNNTVISTASSQWIHLPAGQVFDVSLTVTNNHGCSENIVSSMALNTLNCTNGAGQVVSAGNMFGGYTNPGIRYIGCVPFQVQFNNPFPGSTASWDLGDGNPVTGNNFSHTYIAEDTFDITLTVLDSNGTITSYTFANYIITESVTSSFTYSLQDNCSQVDVSLNNTSSNQISSLWNFGNGTTDTASSTTHTYNSTNGMYGIMLTTIGPRGCQAQSQASVSTVNAGYAWASKYQVCPGSPVNFQFTGTNYMSYLWDFGDGTTSSLVSPVHSFSSAGNYTVTLTVTDASGCPRQFQVPASVSVIQPFASFTVSPTGVCREFSFTNQSSGTPSPAASYCLWNFGDGISQWGFNKTHTYQGPGVYPVTLSVYNQLGCVTKFYDTLVIENPAAGFSVTQDRNCFPMNVTFTDTSHNAFAWNWDFGNGTGSSLSDPAQYFNSQPLLPVTLVITDSLGCTDTAAITEFTEIKSSFIISDSVGCSPFSVSITNESEGAQSFLWNFGDGTTSSSSSPSHTYQANGNYVISLVTQSQGCSDTAYSQAISVQEPVAAFSFSSPGICSSVINFVNNSSNSVSWLWNFGDGSGATVQNPVHVYSQPGDYTVSLVAFSSSGCSDTIIYQNPIHISGPVAAFSLSASELCGPGAISFTDNSLSAVSWNWNFGDGNVSSAQNPQHYYSAAGTFTPTLQVTDINGCSSFYSYPSALIIHPAVISSFSISDSIGCAPHSVSFTNNSINAQQFSWSFGNGNTSSSNAASETFSSPGIYQVQLISSGNSGCSDTSFAAITVNSSPVFDFSTDHVSGCSPLTAIFNASGNGLANAAYEWFVNGTPASTQPQPSLQFSSPGLNAVSLVITNSSGCSDTVTHPGMIFVQDTFPPQQSPVLVATVISNESVHLVWTPSNDVNFSAYKIYRKNATSLSYTLIATITGSLTVSYTDSLLNTLGNSYCYKIQTTDNCGYELPLDSLTEHCTVEVTATEQNNNNVLVSWNPYGTVPVGGYEVYREEGIGGNPMMIAALPASQTNYLDTMIYCPGAYSYRIRAVHVNGNQVSSWSDTAIAVPQNTPLYQVEMVRSTVIDDANILTEWSSPATNPQNVSGYEIYRTEENGNFELLATLPAQAHDYIDNSVQVKSSSYRYRVVALNTCGSRGIPVNISSSILLKAKEEDHKTKLEWTAYEGWSTGVDYYVIERQKEDGTWEIIRIVDGSITQFEND